MSVVDLSTSLLSCLLQALVTDLARDLAIKSKCETVKTHHSCKVDLCFVGGTSEGAVQKNRIVDAAKKLIYDGGCGQFAIDGDKQGLKIGGFYTIDNPREEFKTDKWCHAPKKSMKVQFSKS